MPDINTKVKLTGEAEYKQALNNINSGMKVLNSEMKLTSAQFAENGKSVEALKAKNDVLTRSIYSQEEKLKLMKDQLKKTADAYGEGSSKTMKLQAAVNSAETELVQMKTALKQNETAIDEASDKSKGFGDVLQGVADKLGIKIPDSVMGATGALNKVKAGTAIAVAGFTALAKAIIDVEKKLISMTKESAAAADELLTLSSQTGLSAKQLQEFQYAADFVDVSMETLQSSLVKVTANMAKNNEAFGELGVSITNADGSLRNANDVFLETIDALGTIENNTERDAKAMELFGKSATDLNPLIGAGSSKLKELGQEAEDTGYVLDDLALDKLAKMDDAFQKLDKTQEGLRNKLSSEFAPYATSALEKVTDAIQTLGEAMSKSGIVDAFGMLLEDVLAIIKPVDDLNGTRLPLLQELLYGIAKACALISDTLSFITNAVGFVEHFSILHPEKHQSYLTGMSTALGFNGNSRYQQISDLQTQRRNEYAGTLVGEAALDQWYASQQNTSSWTDQQIIDWANQNGYEVLDLTNNSSASRTARKLHNLGIGVNAAGTGNWRGGWSWVGENGPELAYLPRGSQVKSATESRESGGDVFNITIDAKNVREFNDIVRIAQNSRMNLRKGALA